MGGLFVIAVVLAAFLLFLFFRTAVVVPQQNAYVVERLGRFSGVLLFQRYSTPRRRIPSAGGSSPITSRFLASTIECAPATSRRADRGGRERRAV